jgi:glycerol uptake facilitator-like aquaporin
MFGRQRIATLVAEFLGTAVLTLLVLSVQRSTIGVPFFVATAAGLTLALMVFALNGAASGFFNPAVTLARWTARQLDSVTAALFIVVQLLGAWAAFGLYSYFVGTELQQLKGNFSGRVLTAEAVGAGLLAFGIAAALAQGVTRSATAAYAGVALMLGAIAASAASLGLLNPATALGVRAWDIWGSVGWSTYVLGPILGSIVGYNLYNMVFAAPAPARAAAVSASSAAKRPAAKRKTARKK